jgi:hypothetical protein
VCVFVCACVSLFVFVSVPVFVSGLLGPRKLIQLKTSMSAWRQSANMIDLKEVAALPAEASAQAIQRATVGTPTIADRRRALIAVSN